MAKQTKKYGSWQEKPRMDYGAAVRELRRNGPARVYLLWGAEDYLRDDYLEKLKALCLAEGTEAFNYHRLDGAKLKMEQIGQCLEAMPFMGEHTLTEVRDLDIAGMADYEPAAWKSLLADVPAWATLVFVYAPEKGPDGRLTAVREIKKAAKELEFTTPDARELTGWVIRRVESMDKTIDPATAAHLIWVCGERMNTLIPEITKIASYAPGKAVTAADIDAVAKRAPDTTIRQMLLALGDGKYDSAAGLMADLLADREQPPAKQLAAVSGQFRQLYVARVAMDSGQGDELVTACFPELSGWRPRLEEIRRIAGRFPVERLARAVRLCAACDYAMKNTGGKEEILMKQLLLQLALDRA